MHELSEPEADATMRQRGVLVLASLPLLIGAGVIVALLFAALQARPAGASTPAVPTAPVMAAVPAPATTAVSTFVNGKASEVVHPGAEATDPIASTVAAVVAPVVTPLSAVTGPTLAAAPAALTDPVARALEPIADPVVASLPHVPTVVADTGTDAVEAVHAAPTSIATQSPVVRFAAVSGSPKGPAVEWRTSGSRPPAPRPLPPPLPPFLKFPLVTGTSPSGESLPSAGSNAIAVTPGSGLLLPDPTVSRVDPEQSGSPELLFDSRYSPPG